MPQTTPKMTHFRQTLSGRMGTTKKHPQGVDEQCVTSQRQGNMLCFSSLKNPLYLRTAYSILKIFPFTQMRNSLHPIPRQ